MSPISWVHHWVWFIPLALVVVVAAMSVTDIATSRTFFWLVAMAIGVLMLPSNLLLPYENGVKKQFPVWLRSMYEPYVVVGIMFILTACILPRVLLGISRDREDAVAEYWSQFVRVLALFILLASHAGATFVTCPWIATDRFSIQ